MTATNRRSWRRKVQLIDPCDSILEIVEENEPWKAQQVYSIGMAV